MSNPKKRDFQDILTDLDDGHVHDHVTRNDPKQLPLKVVVTPIKRVTSTPIPRSFLLQLPVFEAGTLYRVEARIRFAMKDGRPTFSYSLYQTDVIERDAFNEVRAAVIEGTKLPLFAGAPE